jgi:inositol-pentakisphosphate 2-kinase
MSTKFSLESTAVSDWKFLAEGGANLVLSYTGSLPHLQGRLLRLRKKKIDASEVHAIPNHVDVRFGTDIITPLMGKDQVVEMVLIDAPRNWLQEMKDHLKLTDARTSARTEVDGIDEAAGVAVLAEDLVHGRGVIAFEIKVSESSTVSLVPCTLTPRR